MNEETMLFKRVFVKFFKGLGFNSSTIKQVSPELMKFKEYFANDGVIRHSHRLTEFVDELITSTKEEIYLETNKDQIDKDLQQM